MSHLPPLPFSKSVGRALRRFSKLHHGIDKLARGYRVSQWESPAAIRTQQKRREESLLAHCWQNVPYYRDQWNILGFSSPNSLSWEQIPLLSKQDIRTHRDSLSSKDLKKRKWYATKSGGSTGEPVTVLHDLDYRIHSEAKKALCFEWAGYHFGDSLVKLWGAEQDILATRKTLRSRAAGYLANRHVLNSFLMSPGTMRTYIGAINRIKPLCLHAYASSIYELAGFAKREGLPVHIPKTIITTSETLHPFMRKRIEEVFQCQVYDQYGSRELSCVASECEHHRLHINAETLLLEVVNEKGRLCPPGTEGELVVTSLINHAMPLLRYRIGDRGIIDGTPCPCGRGLPVLKQVSGRLMDCFRRADGSVIPGEYFIHFLGVVFNEGWVRQVQVTQEDYDRVRVALVTDAGKDVAPGIAQMKKIVNMVMGEECRVDIDLKEKIEPAPSGKFRYTICNLPPI